VWFVWFADSGGFLLWHTKKADSLEAGKAAVREALCDGSAYRTFQTMLRMQGVSPALAENVADWLPRASFTTLLYCPAAGLYFCYLFIYFCTQSSQLLMDEILSYLFTT